MAVGAAGAGAPFSTARTHCSIHRTLRRSRSTTSAESAPPARSASRKTVSILCAIVTMGSMFTIEESPLTVCMARKRSRTARGCRSPR